MISSHFPTLPSLPALPLAPGAASAGARDLPSLAVFLDLMTPTLDATVPTLSERQVLAAPGTALPNDTDAGDEAVDPAFAWLTPDAALVPPPVLASAIPPLPSIAASGAVTLMPTLADTGRPLSSTSIGAVGLVVVPSDRGAIPGGATPGTTAAPSDTIAVMPLPSLPTEVSPRVISADAAPTASPVATENARAAKVPMRSDRAADIRLPALSSAGIKPAAQPATAPMPMLSLAGNIDQSRPAHTVTGLTANVVAAPLVPARAEKLTPSLVLAGASTDVLAPAPMRAPRTRFETPASVLATASQPQTAMAITGVPPAFAEAIAVPHTRERGQSITPLSPVLSHWLPAQAPLAVVTTVPVASTPSTMFPAAVAAAPVGEQERFVAPLPPLHYTELPLTPMSVSTNAPAQVSEQPNLAAPMPALPTTASPLKAPMTGATTAAMVSVATPMFGDTNAPTQARKQFDVAAPLPTLIPTASLLTAPIGGMVATAVVSVAPTMSAGTNAPTQARAQRELIAPLRPLVATTTPPQPILAFSPGLSVASVPKFSFAEAVAAAQARERGEPIDPLSPAPVAATQPQVTLAATTLDQPALDMARQDWPQTMIGRIEALRDAADAVDTSIRLLPDALGAIDVSVRQEGETVHLRFSAEQAQTRQLLAEAQPRLQELAEARGLRLGGSGVDNGANHGGTGHQPHRAPPLSNIPVPAAHVPAGARAMAASDLNQRLA